MDYDTFSRNFDAMERLAEANRMKRLKNNQLAELEDLSLLFATMPIDEIQCHLRRKVMQMQYTLQHSQRSLLEISSRLERA